MYVVRKVSSPGWEKPAKSLDEVHSILMENICAACLAYPSLSITIAGTRYETATIDELLTTSCGVEFDVDEGIK